MKTIKQLFVSAVFLMVPFLIGVAPLSAVPVQAIVASAGPDLGISYPAASGLASTDVRVIVAKFIRVAMGLLGMIAVIIVLIGGYTWMTAGGNEEKVEEAKKWIYAGIIGLAIILSAYAIASFVVNSLTNATTSGQNNIPLN